MYWEDFEIEKLMVTPSRTVGGEDLGLFIKLSGLDNPLFTAGAEIGGGARIVPAPLQLSIGMGLCQKAGFFDHVAAVLEFDQMKFLRPVHLGDALRMEVTAESKRPTSQPERGLVVLDYKLKNQDDQAAMSAKAVYLMRRRPE